MNTYLIVNAKIVNEGQISHSDILIENGRISKIASQITLKGNVQVIDAQGDFVLPGVIDDQVHFREPGLTHKANIATESAAAVAGGVTTFLSNPTLNLKPLLCSILKKNSILPLGLPLRIIHFSWEEQTTIWKS